MSVTDVATAPAAVDPRPHPDGATRDAVPADLRRRMARGAVVSTGAQAAAFLLRITSLMVLARLLLTEDFGLVNMVTAFTGFLGLLRDVGLSMAAVQQVSITSAQSSTLFWVNLGVGGALAGLAAVTAPALIAFYGEPRLFWLTVAVGTSFLFHGAAVQHRAILQRNLRFSMLAAIDTASLAVAIVAAISMALAGHGYWALVAMTVTPPAAGLLGAWLATGWIPGPPQRRCGIRSMLTYGGAVTLNNLIVHVAYNADKVLIGRFWGAEALGIYGRAYQLINLPTENLNSTIGLVAFPALSRVQHDPARLRRYFLKGYGVFLALVMPLTVGCALFADDIVLVFLGPSWRGAAEILRLLAPTILTFAVANPLYWLMMARGRATRCLVIALVMTPLLIAGYALGLPYGPSGVALAFSITMGVALVPVVWWATQGTAITMRDIAGVIRPAAVSIALAAASTLALRSLVDPVEPVFLRLMIESACLFGLYLGCLLFVMKQTPLYMGLLREVGGWRAR